MIVREVEKRFRRNVAVVVLDRGGRILAGHRSDRAGAWQLPQGGIDPGESEEAAMFRELEEEIGTSNVEVIAKLPESIRYDWPPELFERGYHGQEQSYFLVRMLDDPASMEMRRSEEFDRFEWLGLQEFLGRLSGFKAEAYRTALERFTRSFPDLIKG